MPSGFGEVTRWPPRTPWSALRIGFPPGPVPLEERLALAADLGRPEQEVLGRDVLVAQAARLLLGPLDDPLRARVEAQRAALDPRSAAEDRGELGAERRQVDAEPPERLGRDAVVRLDERGQQVLGVEDRALEGLGELLGGEDGLLGLLGESIQLHWLFSRGRSAWRGSVAGPGIVRPCHSC